MEALLGILVFMGLIFGLALMYKKRHRIAVWLEDPGMATHSDPNHKAKILRRIIEDTQEELDMLKSFGKLEEEEKG